MLIGMLSRMSVDPERASFLHIVAEQVDIVLGGVFAANQCHDLA